MMAAAPISDTQAAAEMAEAYEQDPSDGADDLCWTALGRVVDDDPVYVFHDGDENGANVGVMIQTGPFSGCEVRAMLSAPLGAGYESRPIKKGQRVLVQFLEGKVNGLSVVTHTVPGGAENPIPKAMAGVAVDEGALQNEHLIAPPKGANVRFYVRGAAFLVRLKGNTIDADPKKSFVGEFYVEGDDGDADGFHNTFIRLAGNPSTGKLSIKAKLADGTELSLDDGVASLTSPNGQNSLQVSDNDVRVVGKTFFVGVETIVLNGTVLVNVPAGAPPLPPMAAIHGVAGLNGIPSTSFFIGR